MFVITGALFLIILMLILPKYLKRRKLLNTVPGPKCVPLFGNIFNVHLNYKGMIQTIGQLQQKYGNVVKVEFGPIAAYFVKDKDLINKVYSQKKHLRKPNYFNKFLKTWFENSVATSDGLYWKTVRKIHLPALGSKNIEYFLESFNNHSKILNKIFEENVGKDSFNLNQVIEKCTLDITCSTVLNYNSKSQEQSKSKLFWSSQILMETMMTRLWSILYQFDWIYKFSELYQKEKKSASIFKNLVETILKERKLYLSTVNNNNLEEGFPVIDNMLNASKNEKMITDQVIKNEVHTFLLGGVDTIAAVVKFTLYLLSKHQDIQNRVAEELNNIFGNSTRDITMDDFNSMKYTGMVVKESLRKYPIIPYVSRILSEDLQYGNYTLLKGSMFFACIYDMHNDPKYFENPEEFNPERFSPENLKNIEPLTYIPFASGPRICLGMRFGIVATRVILATILRQYKIFPAIPEFSPILIPKAVLNSTNGMHIKIIKR